MSVFQVSLTPEMRAVLARISHLSISENWLAAEDGTPLRKYGIPAGRGVLVRPPASPRRVRIKPSFHLSSTAEIVELRSNWKHDNIMPFLGYYLSQWGAKVGIAIVTPDFINGGYLVYRKRHPEGLDLALRLSFVKDITSGVEYLHSRSPPIYYLQLSAYNIYIDENLNAVIGEMNSAQEANDNGEVIHCTRRSPKSQMVRKVYSFATDVWDWACLAYEILTDGKAEGDEAAGFKNGSMSRWKLPGEADKLLALAANAPRPEHAASLQALSSLLPLCWDVQRRNRPTIFQIRQQAFDAGSSVTATLEEWSHLQIFPDRLRIHPNSRLGRGGFGEVVAGTLDGDSSEPREVAVKQLIMTGAATDPVRLMKRLARELRIWAGIRHQNVLELIGWCLDENSVFPRLISPRLGGSLLEYLKQVKPDLEQRVSFVKGITEGLACLHTFHPPICHADLKPSNVLLDANLNAVLCDFGLTTFIASTMGVTTAGLMTSTNIKGTVRYMSPELRNNISHSLESDIWAWGCTVFEVLRDYIPYAAYADLPMIVAMIQEVPPGDASLVLPRSSETIKPTSVKVLQLLHSALPQCWSFNPERRPPITRIATGIRNGDSILPENQPPLAG